VTRVASSGRFYLDHLQWRRDIATDPEIRRIASSVIEAGKFSNVSTAAMCYRLHDLGFLADEEECRQIAIF
jgi:hypothetical protein